jgi:tryptophan synthase alpha chain
MNRIDELFQSKGNNILSVYFTAGYPLIDSTTDIIKHLVNAGADMIEIGMPFSDPLADGPVIQKSSEVSLRNGMTLNRLFQQLHLIRNVISIPIILMGYINPVLKFGIEEFCRKSSEIGIDGLILPDLTPEIYNDQYPNLFISPQTSESRIKMIDKLSRGFVYVVSSSSTTGIKKGFSENQLSYLKKIKNMNLTNPRLVGFGISDSKSFTEVCRLSNGAIVGSAFIKMLTDNGPNAESINRFIKEIKG